MRVAHLSDIHLLSLRGVGPLAFFGKRATGGLNLLLKRGREYSQAVVRALVSDINAVGVDHVIVSGDLTNLSLRPEFELAREVLEGLRLGPADVTVVPGNHDRYTLGSAWRDPFSRVMAPFIAGDIQPQPGRFPFARLRGEVAVVALSTAHPSPPFIAVGTLGKRQLAAAEALLQHPRVVGRFRLVVLHHPPRSPSVSWSNRLTDAERFIALIARVGAELVIYGHLHRNEWQQLDGPAGPVPLIGVNSGTWLLPHDPARRASYNIYEIADGRLQRVINRGWDVDAEAFVELLAREPRADGSTV